MGVPKITFDVAFANCKRTFIEKTLGTGQGNFEADVQATNFQKVSFKSDALESFDV